MMIPDYAKNPARLIALMPVDDRINDRVAAMMLREKMLEELYFKGYPKIPLVSIDDKLQNMDRGGAPDGSISPKAIGDLLKVDAILYCTLSESRKAIHFFYAPTALAASCELRSAKTGETLWQARYGVVEWNFGYSRYDLEMKASQVYESAIQKVVDKVMETLPDGPDLSG